MFDRKTKSFGYKKLGVFVRVLEGEKKGAPKNEGASGNVYEDERHEDTACGGSGNVNDNKQVISVFRES